MKQRIYRPQILSLLAIAWMCCSSIAQESLPGQMDLRPNFEKWQLPVKLQGKRPTCSVFAAVGCLDYALARKLGHAQPLSEEFANWAASQLIGRPKQDGHFFFEVVDAFEKYGCCLAEELPYSAKFDARQKPTEELMQSATKLKREGLTLHWLRKLDAPRGLQDADIAAMKAVLARGWPLAVGSYHSIMLTGYQDDASLPGGGKFYVRDSEGNEKEITYQAAKERLHDMLWAEAPLPEKIPSQQ